MWHPVRIFILAAGFWSPEIIGARHPEWGFIIKPLATALP
jgi:hypothetical protein